MLVAPAVAVLLLTGCGPRTSAGSDPAPVDQTAPEGWRWEAFRGVEVAVPGDWGWTNSGQRIGQWCVGERGDRDLSPAVGRPGVSTMVACPSEGDGPPPDTLTRNTGDVVAFEAAAGARPGDVGDRRTVVAGKVAVLVQTADPALRARIAETVRAVEVTSTGCPMDHPLAHDPGRRPEPGTGLADLVDVRSVTACKYAVDRPGDRTDLPPLTATRQFTGQSARDLVAALAAAPAGGGPNRPDSCLPEYAYGDEVLLLDIRHAEGVEHVVVTYAGCDHNGIDDGTTVRRLTREAVRPLVDGPLAMLGGFSSQLHGILGG
ncbi:hypothetical protein [Nocardioides iriomotensis]|uniref:Uncharacterized protein n=1 Tax=Nocardioides iriomotensis TaxID=715784 RepID=A0A4Q5J5K7_9ACTN|nr:hypothetical protein [Nocardioides iriomotensis]RYU13932.1 hypothetical protein ETU37_05270 [Nocardioides iriomotensis]